MAHKKTNPFNFEKSLDQLTQLVERMEHGNLSLEDSLKCFEEGIGLIRECQQALTNAEQKVQILMKQQGLEILKPYSPESSNND